MDDALLFITDKSFAGHVVLRQLLKLAVPYFLQKKKPKITEHSVILRPFYSDMRISPKKKKARPDILPYILSQEDCATDEIPVCAATPDRHIFIYMSLKSLLIFQGALIHTIKEEIKIFCKPGLPAGFTTNTYNHFFRQTCGGISGTGKLPGV